MVVKQRRRTPNSPLVDVYVQSCLQCRDRMTYKRGLCNRCYQRAYRDGSLWQYVPTEYLDDYTAQGQLVLDTMIEWIFEFNIEELVSGFADGYVDGTWFVDLNGSSKVSNIGYTISGMCNECNDDQTFARGLCKRCYNANRYLRTDIKYPTSDYVKNVKGYVYYVLNYHMDRVLDIALEYGVEIRTL